MAGAASLGVRNLIDGPRRPARVIAAFPVAVYLELSIPGPEPRVLALVTPTAVRLPNAVVVTADQAAEPGPAGRLRRGAAAEQAFLVAETADGGASVGDGIVQAGRIRVPVRRWWDPSPVLGPLSRGRLEQGCGLLEGACATSPRRPGLDGHPAPAALAAHCGAGDLAGAVEVAENLVGLGPGLTPSGDDVLAGLLLALRLLGGAIRGGTRAVWLADWLGAAITSDASDRTTSVSATLLHCAARGQAAAEVAAVLRAFAGQEPAVRAATRLLAAGHTSGADLAWGLAAGCRAALALSANVLGSGH
ncbi:MAG TPA: DUF2877 domain-containing protein [Streptosporangiaceae bacterium]|nr:DUF2877 domain-containing protein [Streptosporangiaceae bacterium]